MKKIMATMYFLMDQLGWKRGDHGVWLYVFCFPKGLIKKELHSITTTIMVEISYKSFLEKFVNKYDKEAPEPEEYAKNLILAS
ncbi:hypothetical protein C5167_014354 [Papaver somniferum]|uniref:Uncharacterized protein n=1 Tax=Papaver somniferum TaxID=3469 RepID=A0A4Y7J2Y9_PAPSO|nr:hypothetical protein C5167_014354 [Papaver somniferum]